MNIVMLRVAIFVLSMLSFCTMTFAAEESKRERVEAASLDQFDVRNVEGWSIYVRKQSFVEHEEEMAEVMDHLQSQLYQVRLAMPAAPVAIMQERVPIWIEYDAGLGTAFHPSVNWVLDRGHRTPSGLRSTVGLSQAKNFCKFALHQPWVIGHELTHGYDFLYLGEGRGYSNARLKIAYERAKQSGGYEKVLARYSQGTRHYGLNNPMEYLAESTEAYFGTNDFYPFVRAELREHDAQMCDVLEDTWGVDRRRQDRITRSLVRRLEATGNNRLAKADDPAVDTADYKQRTIEGWTVHVHPDLDKRKAFGDEMCKLLRHKLHLIGRYMPEASLTRLRSIPIWLEKPHSGSDYITYYRNKQQLDAAGANDAKLHAVEIADCNSMHRYQALQPFALLNQLARATFNGHLSDAQTEQIEKARDRAAESDDYSSVLRFDGQRVKHPCLKSPEDFFAEMTVAYFGVNDHYPFLQFETRQHDPETCKLLADLWGGKAK